MIFDSELNEFDAQNHSKKQLRQELRVSELRAHELPERVHQATEKPVRCGALCGVGTGGGAAPGQLQPL